MASYSDEPHECATVDPYKNHPEDTPLPFHQNPKACQEEDGASVRFILQQDSDQATEKGTSLKIRTGEIWSWCVMTCVGFRFDMFILLGFSVYQTVLGGINIHQCPAAPIIPIFQLTAGCIGSLRALMTLIPWYLQICAEGNDEDVELTCLACLQRVFTFAIIIFPIMMSSPVFGITFDSEDPSKDSYCDHTLYWFSFWLICADFIYLTIAFLVIFIFCGRNLIQQIKLE